MQNREAAVFVTNTLMSITNDVIASRNAIYEYEKQGKVSKEEAETYCQNVMGPLEQMLSSVLGPLFETHPGLRPHCRCCKTAAEDD